MLHAPIELTCPTKTSSSLFFKKKDIIISVSFPHPIPEVYLQQEMYIGIEAPLFSFHPNLKDGYDDNHHH